MASAGVPGAAGAAGAGGAAGGVVPTSDIQPPLISTCTSPTPWIEPATAGPNQIHLYLFDADDGSQFTAAKEVRLALEQPEREIGPLDVDLRRAGPGHYTAPAATFAAPGDWTATVVMRTSRFDENEAQIEVPIR